MRKNNMCFACSPVNPIGLHLSFTMDKDVCYTFFTAGDNHQGWDGFVHGGLLVTLLDEVMAQWLWQKRIYAMTAEMKVRFSLPVTVGQEVLVKAQCEKAHGKLYQLTARIVLPDGRRAVKAEGKYLTLQEAPSKNQL